MSKWKKIAKAAVAVVGAGGALATGVGALAAGPYMAAAAQRKAAGEAATALQAGGNAAKGDVLTASNEASAMLDPYAKVGDAALAKMGDLQSGKLSGKDFVEADPGYKFRTEQATQAMERSAAAKGGLQSGTFATSLADYISSSASQEFQQAWQRLFATADMGRTVKTTQAELRYNTGSALANIDMGVAQGIAQTQLARGEAKAGMIQGIQNNIFQAAQIGAMFMGKGGLGGGNTAAAKSA